MAAPHRKFMTQLWNAHTSLDEGQSLAITEKMHSFDIEGFLDSIGKRTVSFARREVIFAQGAPSDTVLYLRSGGAQLSVLSDTGKEAIVARIGPGDFLGERALSGHSLRAETARATVATAVIVIPKEEMRLLLHRHPDLADRFIEHMLARNARLESDLADQLFNSSEKRLARTLLLLAECEQYEDANGVPRISPDVTQEMLAEMIGATRSRVNVFLNKFKKLGFIDYDATGLTIRPSLRTIVLRD